MRRLGCGGLMTEFGMGTDAPSVATMDAADAFLQGWIAWEYKQYIPKTGYANCLWNPDGSFNTTCATYYARTYARAVAGRTVSMRFNDTSSAFSLVYQMRPTIPLPTEIFASAQFRYPRGYDIVLSPAGVAVWKAVSPDVIHVWATSAATAATVLTVTLTPK
jgi:endoglycosylceramidase